MENKTRHEKRSNCRCMRRCSENNLRLMYNEKLGLFLMPKNCNVWLFHRLIMYSNHLNNCDEKDSPLMIISTNF